MERVNVRYVVAVVAVLLIGASACGSAAGETAASTTTGAPTTTRAATTSSTTVPVDPDETLVADIRDEVSVLSTFVEPDGEPAVFEYEITNPTYFDNRLTLMVTDRTDDGRWLRVQVPVRPNGSEAWIRAEDAEVRTHRYRAEVDLTERAVTVWNGDEVVASTGAVIGKDTTPTPVGRFFVNDLVEKWDGSAYGPYILSLSGFSEALETFNGGVPVIAIHGTNRPDLLGGAHSNGCIRIPNDVVELLASTVPMGTPVDIVA